MTKQHTAQDVAKFLGTVGYRLKPQGSGFWSGKCPNCDKHQFDLIEEHDKWWVMCGACKDRPAITKRINDLLNGAKPRTARKKKEPTVGISHYEVARACEIQFGVNFHFSQKTGWWRWVDTHWTSDDAVSHLQMGIRKIIKIIGAGILDYAELKSLFSSSTIGGAKTYMSASEVIRIDEKMWDQKDAYNDRLNVANGTVDIMTGEMWDHDRTELFTACADVNYLREDDLDPAMLELWEAFVEVLFPDEQERLLVQTFLGYSQSGRHSDHHFLITYGAGGTGKNTFQEAIMSVMGGYCGHIGSKIVLEQKFPDHETGMMQFRGKRLAVCDEIPRDKAFDKDKINMITGSGFITARLSKSDHITYKNRCKLWLVGNHLPSFGDTTGDGIIRRPMIIKTPDQVNEEWQDRIVSWDFHEKLESDAMRSVILNWLQNGYWNFVEEGRLKLPESVQVRNSTEFTADDWISDFIESKFEQREGGFIYRNDIAEQCRIYCDQHNRKTPTLHWIYNVLRKRGWEEQKRSEGRGFTGWVTKRDLSSMW